MTEDSGNTNSWTRHDPLNEWLAIGERGISSNTMVMHLTGRVQRPRFGPDVPYDPDDLRRCERLLRQVPLLRLHLPRMATLSPVWAALVERWDEIVQLCEQEVPGCFEDRRPTGSAPQAYALIRSCRDAAAERSTAGGA